MYNLYLDDLRAPVDSFQTHKNPIYHQIKWVVVRNYDEFVTYITNAGLPELVSFDHDLCDEHYNEGAKTGFQQFDYNNVNEKTGMECVKWLCEYCLDNQKFLPEYLIHTMNPAGDVNMRSYLENYKKHVEN